MSSTELPPAIFGPGIGKGPRQFEGHVKLFREKGIESIIIDWPPYHPVNFDFDDHPDYLKDKFPKNAFGFMQSRSGLAAILAAEQFSALYINSAPARDSSEVAPIWMHGLITIACNTDPSSLKRVLQLLEKIPKIGQNNWINFLATQERPQQLAYCYQGHLYKNWTPHVLNMPNIPTIFSWGKQDYFIKEAGFGAIARHPNAILIARDGGHEPPAPPEMLNIYYRLLRLGKCGRW